MEKPDFSTIPHQATVFKYHIQSGSFCTFNNEINISYGCDYDYGYLCKWKKALCKWKFCPNTSGPSIEFKMRRCGMDNHASMAAIVAYFPTLGQYHPRLSKIDK